MSDFRTVIIGAGVVGLATARALATGGRDVLVVEQHGTIGSETSARNSEVIHAGIYYPQGSLKARLCVDGKHKLYDYCATRHVAHRNCGKLIVGTNENQTEELKDIARRAAANGVDDLRLIGPDEAQTMEAQLSCVAALHSPSTGIIDSHGLMLALQGEAQDHGCQIAFNTPVERIDPLDGGGFSLVCGDADRTVVTCDEVVVSAGLHVADLLHKSGLGALMPKQKLFAKGNYFRLNGASPFSRLIYPVPEPGGLGVHVTIDLAGQARFGPDVEWVDALDYEVNPRRADKFYGEVRKYWPALADGSLEPDYSGIRPKLVGQPDPSADFAFFTQDHHNLAGLTVLAGIESPGLSSCLAIADHVQELMT
ncbi:NAD(P)/FAD-dependent oxidoreductase [Pseudahrensia aquimaris]|uniref:NAD(P)/FAD-dependent oxidoreductase n=1 Tax=Pseudahrensia aquimaris TaxID=744461 RepID=A0ABW3FJ31_9HYPH